MAVRITVRYLNPETGETGVFVNGRLVATRYQPPSDDIALLLAVLREMRDQTEITVLVGDGEHEEDV